MLDGEAAAPPEPRLRDIASEEFWIVARSFFAPIYGILLVWKRLSRLTRQLDRKPSPRSPANPPFHPAE